MNIYIISGYFMAWDVRVQRIVLKHSIMQIESSDREAAERKWVERVKEDKSAASIKIADVFGPFQKVAEVVA